MASSLEQKIPVQGRHTELSGETMYPIAVGSEEQDGSEEIVLVTAAKFLEMMEKTFDDMNSLRAGIEAVEKQIEAIPERSREEILTTVHGINQRSEQIVHDIEYRRQFIEKVESSYEKQRRDATLTVKKASSAVRRLSDATLEGLDYDMRAVADMGALAAEGYEGEGSDEPIDEADKYRSYDSIEKPHGDDHEHGDSSGSYGERITATVGAAREKLSQLEQYKWTVDGQKLDVLDEISRLEVQYNELQAQLLDIHKAPKEKASLLARKRRLEGELDEVEQEGVNFFNLYMERNPYMSIEKLMSIMTEKGKLPKVNSKLATTAMAESVTYIEVDTGEGGVAEESDGEEFPISDAIRAVLDAEKAGTSRPEENQIGPEPVGPSSSQPTEVLRRVAEPVDVSGHRTLVHVGHGKVRVARK